MKKKLDTRFPAARIKKIMQADEDVGKIALAVPVLVSKALELFLQDLCDRTYEITLQRGAKTVNSLHLKHCVQSYNVFDFLRDIVSRVPDYGHGHSDTTADSQIIPKRRKAVDDEYNDSDEETKRSKMLEMGRASSSGRGRGRGRRRGRGRGSRASERESLQHDTEPDPYMSLQHDNEDVQNPGTLADNESESKEISEDNILVIDGANSQVKYIDLNAELNDNRNTTTIPAVALSVPAATDIAVKAETTAVESKHEEIPGWSLSDVDKMSIDPLQLVQLSTKLDEDEENYDEEG